MGARNPAGAATLVKLAWNGRPEGLPRGAGATPRDAIPLYRWARAVSAMAGKVRSRRRESTIAPRISHAIKTDTIGRMIRHLAALIANLAVLCLAADLSPSLRDAATALQRGD